MGPVAGGFGEGGGLRRAYPRNRERRFRTRTLPQIVPCRLVAAANCGAASEFMSHAHVAFRSGRREVIAPSSQTSAFEGFARKPVDWIYLFETLGYRFAVDRRNGARLELASRTWEYLADRARHVRPGRAARALHLPAAIAEELAAFQGVPPRGLSDDPPPRLRQLCLNVTHACNLNCAYCFENWPTLQGGFDRRGQGQMTRAVAFRAVDLLVAESGDAETLEIDFFGGEPLLNFDVVKATVNYALERSARCGKRMVFNLTTNGTRLTEEVQQFLIERDIAVLISLDGPAEVHDTFRRFHNGAPSYEIVLRNAKRLQEGIAATPRTGCRVTVRGTFLRNTIDFESSVYALAAEGFDEISVENGVLREDRDVALRHEDLPELRARYDHFVQRLTDDLIAGTIFIRHFHMVRALEAAARTRRTMRECGAGRGYLAVSADGGLYPCHTFVGVEQMKMGSVDEGIVRPQIGQRLWDTTIDTKKRCRRCWARALCGGGCHANAHYANHRIDEPEAVSCALMQHRLRLGFYMLARLEMEAPCVLQSLVPAYVCDTERPKRRKGLRAVAHGDGLLVYDPVRKKLHVLERLWACVWKLCDSRRTVGTVLQETAEILALPLGKVRGDGREAIRQLREWALLDGP
jgi:uncharacterized protein